MYKSNVALTGTPCEWWLPGAGVITRDPPLPVTPPPVSLHTLYPYHVTIETGRGVHTVGVCHQRLTLYLCVYIGGGGCYIG